MSFWTKLVETDDRDIKFKITEIVPLIQNVHDMKFFYTFLSWLAQIGKLKKTYQTKYLKAALVVTSKTTTAIDAVAHFKLILQKQKKIDTWTN